MKRLSSSSDDDDDQDQDQDHHMITDSDSSEGEELQSKLLESRRREVEPPEVKSLSRYNAMRYAPYRESEYDSPYSTYSRIISHTSSGSSRSSNSSKTQREKDKK